MSISRLSEGVNKLQLAEDNIDNIDDIEHSDEDKKRLGVKRRLRQNSVQGKCCKVFNPILQLNSS